MSLISSGGVIRLVGLEGPSSAAITSGGSGTAGTHIVFIDFDHLIDIQVAGVGSTILIHNGESVTRAGNVALIW